MAPDARFARLQTDPRFRRPKQKHLKAEIDERFKDALSEDFGKAVSKARVDKRGRALASTSGADSMKRFYRLASPEEGEAHVDYARGEGVLESSGSEAESESEVEEEELELGGKRKVRYLPSDSESEEDEEEEEESADEGQLRVNLDEDEEVDFGPDDDDEEEEEEGVDPTTRVAAVNLDWDHLRAADIYTIFNSFLKAPPTAKGEAPRPPPGKLLHVRIYPSEFGKERMAQEDAAGPGGGLWKKLEKATRRRKVSDGSDEDGDSGDEEEGDSDDEEEDAGQEEDGASDAGSDADAEALSDDGLDPELDDLEIMSEVSDNGSEDIDMDQLRKYQLERLRYYYAIATFSNVEAAQLVHDELNGTEFERTANILDLSYVPEGMEFDDEVHDECNKEPKGYKGNEFVTDALRHSKVKLTWDQDDPNRAKVTRRALTREEIEDEDFGNLVAASSDDDDEEEEEEQAEAEGGEGEKKKSKKDKAKERKEKLRALLMSGGDTADIWGKAGAAWQDELADIRAGKTSKSKKEKKGEEVEITFKPALTSAAPVDEENLTSLERYKLRQKEKKARKKEKIELKHAEKDEGGAAGDDFFGDDESEDEPPAKPEGRQGKEGRGENCKKGKKEDARSKPKSKRSPSPAPADTAAAALVEDPTHHFDLKDLLTAEKNEGKKRKRHRKKAKDGKELELGPDGFAASVDVADPRFAAIYDEPAFAIDPTHSKFTDTSVNREILKRARDKHAEGRERGAKSGEGEGEKGLSELVESVKAKAGGRARKRSRKH